MVGRSTDDRLPAWNRLGIMKEYGLMETYVFCCYARILSLFSLTVAPVSFLIFCTFHVIKTWMELSADDP